MGKYFGTDGIRGIANIDLTNELAYKVGRFGAYVLTKHRDEGDITIVVGKDTRISCDMLEASLLAGILSVGVNVVQAGVIPTPGISYLVKHEGFDAGVMISASHNSFDYNGIKFFNHEGFKLPDNIEEEIESYLDGKELEKEIGPEAIGKLTRDESLKEHYASYIKSLVEEDISPFRVVLDCANGATSELAASIFSELGVDTLLLSHEPDGININKDCGSTHLDQLKQTLKDGDYDLGFAFDGDGDRVLAVDRHGEEVDGDKMLIILAKLLQTKGQLKEDTITATVMSNLGFLNYANEVGFKVEITGVGDRYVLERMLDKGLSLGGEQSGHIILLDYNNTGDGILTAVKILEALRVLDKPLSDFVEEIPRYPQVLLNAKVHKDKKKDFELNPTINARIKEIEEELEGKGRVLIRPSGTESLVRVMLEGEDEEKLMSYATELKESYERELG